MGLTIAANGLHMACGGFEALSYHLKPQLATERKPCGQPFIRHKLYALLCGRFFFFQVCYENLFPSLKSLFL
jgi:hypothetical protein